MIEIAISDSNRRVAALLARPESTTLFARHFREQMVVGIPKTYAKWLPRTMSFTDLHLRDSQETRQTLRREAILAELPLLAISAEPPVVRGMYEPSALALAKIDPRHGYILPQSPVNLGYDESDRFRSFFNGEQTTVLLRHCEEQLDTGLDPANLFTDAMYTWPPVTIS